MVSTFAWYTANQTTNLALGNKEGVTTATAATTISEQELEVDLTITQSAANNIVLTDDAGNTKGYINGAIVNGSKGSKDLYGSYTVTAAWDSGVTPSQKLAAKDATVNVTLSAEGNAVLLGSVDPTDVHDGSSKKYEYTFTLTVDASGNLQMTAKVAETGFTQKISVNEGTDTATGYFAVRTNNENGVEAEAGATAFSTETTYKVGDVVTYSDVVYVCSAAHTAGAWNAGHFTAAVLHSADKVSAA